MNGADSCDPDHGECVDTADGFMCQCESGFQAHTIRTDYNATSGTLSSTTGVGQHRCLPISSYHIHII